jgi:glycosyltransferase involved in cell wall biosynthesis
VKSVRPDVVHALRIPFEGILAARALANSRVPLAVSVWGNDFTLFAARYPFIGVLVRETVARADLLMADCRRDIHLAHEWGLPIERPTLVAPGAGGIPSGKFFAGPPSIEFVVRHGLPSARPVIVYARRLRPQYVRTDALLAAFPAVLERVPAALLVLVGLRGVASIEAWRARLDSPDSVILLPELPHSNMAELFRYADVSVSPSQHDGTPNTLLEAMACGAFPVAGDIESIREWVESGVNGLLCDPTSSESIANALVQALTDPDLRARAASINGKLIAERADYDQVMARVERVYQVLVDGRSPDLR